jgi:hypothetical protein
VIQRPWDHGFGLIVRNHILSNDWISLMVNLENPKFWKIKEKIIFLFFLYIDIFFYFSQQARIDLRKTDGFIAWSTINSNLDSSRVFLQQVWIWQWLYFATTDKSALKPLNHSFERILFFLSCPRNWQFGHELSLVISRWVEILNLEQIVLGFSSYPGSVLKFLFQKKLVEAIINALLYVILI